MKKKYRIVIAEDHRILREGLRSLLTGNPDYQVVGEAENGMDAIRCSEKHSPDLLLIDLSMPKMDGLDAIREIRTRRPETRILVLTVHKAEEYVFEALKAGADGYLLKDATHEELKLAINSVLIGKTFLSPGISEKLIEGYLAGGKPFESTSPKQCLTQRERQILKMIAEGNRNRDIARFLGISIKTVEKHRSNFMRKLDLHNSSEITAFAMREGMIAK